MTEFWLIAAVMVLAAVIVVLLPIWLHRGNASALTPERINARLFRERLAELDAERADERINEIQHEQLKLDLERTLLADVSTASADSLNPARSGVALAASAGLVIPILAVAYYYFNGFRGEPAEWLQVRERMDAIVQQAVANPEQLPPAALENLPDFARVLQAKVLREGMRDPDQLMLLGISFIELGAGREARDVMLRALELAPDRLDVMLGAAQTLLMTNQGRLDTTSARLLHNVLQQQPNHRGALMMLGFGAFNGGDYNIAQQAWRTLLEQLPPESESAQLLQNSIAEAERLASKPTESSPSEQPSGAAQVTVTVDIAPELQDRLQASDTLFIYARAVEGPPMPLAAVRQSASDFPVEVVLDDSTAMLESMKLSNFQQIVVGARISKGGDVRAQTGDLETLSDPLDLAQGPLSVRLTVDQVVQ